MVDRDAFIHVTEKHYNLPILISVKRIDRIEEAPGGSFIYQNNGVILWVTESLTDILKNCYTSKIPMDAEIVRKPKEGPDSWYLNGTSYPKEG